MASVPLIQRLDDVEGVRQVWYADDASATEGLASVEQYKLSMIGPAFGYFANAVKMWLVTKEEHFDRAKELFWGTNVNVTCHGRPYFGAPLGTDDYMRVFVQEKVNGWIEDLQMLTDIAKSQPPCSLRSVHSWLSAQVLLPLTYHSQHRFPIGAAGGVSVLNLHSGLDGKSPPRCCCP